MDEFRDVEARHHFMQLTMMRVLSRVTEPWSRILYRGGAGSGQLCISCSWQPLSETAVLDIEFRAVGEAVGWRYIADLGRVAASGEWRITDIPLVTHEGRLCADHTMWAALVEEGGMDWPEVSLSYQRRGMEE